MLFFFKQKTAYEMRISDLSSDVCSSDLLASRHPIVCHGLSLSLGGPGPLDETFLGKLRRFLDAHRVPIYSEHLSACSDAHGQLYDLMPLPFTDAAVEHVAARIRRTQDALGRRIAVENIRSEEHTSELQSLMRSSYAVFCLKKKKKQH